MQEYELVWEILNECPRNQMRDVFFDEIETDDLEGEVRRRLKDSTNATIDREDMSDGSTIFHVNDCGLHQKYTFTPV